MPYIREDMADIRVSVEGTGLGESWATAEGANLEADDAKTRPGGMGREVSVGGPASRDDLTATIQFSDVVATWHKWLESLVGVGRVKVAYTFLDKNRTPTGASHTIVGTLKSATLPDVDASSSDVAFYTVVVSCDEQAA
jgi:hypothetical protein